MKTVDKTTHKLYKKILLKTFIFTKGCIHIRLKIKSSKNIPQTPPPQDNSPKRQPSPSKPNQTTTLPKTNPTKRKTLTKTIPTNDNPPKDKPNQTTNPPKDNPNQQQSHP